MPSWKNATPPAPGLVESPEPAKILPPALGMILRPEEVARHTEFHREHRISPELEPYVERYWTVRWDLRGQPAYRAEVLSDPAVNLSVEQGTHLRFGTALPAVLVHGVVTRRFAVDLHGIGAVAAAKFRPGGFTALAGVQPARNNAVRLTDELALDPAGLTAAVLATADDTERLRILDAALAPLAREPAAGYLDLLAVLDRMRGERSLVRVDQVAAECGLAVRALQRLFTTYVGVGAKAVLARYRLQDAVAAIDAGEVEQLAELAVRLGWFDQAHFSRDFRAVVGTSPSEYLHRAQTVRTAQQTAHRPAALDDLATPEPGHLSKAWR